MTTAQPTEQHGRIVVGVDGSPASLCALEWAVGQASLTGAAVQAVTAWQYPAAYGGYPVDAGTDWRASETSVASSLA